MTRRARASGLEASEAHSPAQPPVTAASAQPALERLLVENLLRFWDERVIDRRGGYRLAFDARGRRRRMRRWRCVTQARSTWFFSRLAHSRYGGPIHLELGAHGYVFLRDRLWDRRDGGFFWEVGADGPTDDRKHLYAQAFGILGLVEFSRASGDRSAWELAEQLFELIERRAHDTAFGGYGESWLRNWQPERGGNTNPLGVPAGEKTVNTHMHLMAALSAFLETDRGQRPLLRLRELVSILRERALSRTPTTYPDRHQRDWSPAPGWRTSYGHDVEAGWLAMRACQPLGDPDETMLPVWRGLWENALAYGFDLERGGIYNGGEPGRPADRLDKVWWAQAEALVSARLLYARTGDRRLEQAFVRLLDWIVRGQADWGRGDWHRVVAPDGKTSGSKAGPWEDAFHQGRALLECLAVTSVRGRS